MSQSNVPARYRQVTRNDLHAYFDRLGITPRCSLCGNVEFSLPLMYKITPLVPATEDQIPYLVPHNLAASLGASKEIIFPLTCEHCGTMLLINAEWIAPAPSLPAVEGERHD